MPQAKTEVALQFSERCAAGTALQHCLFCSTEVIWTKSCAAANEKLHCNIEKAALQESGAFLPLSCGFQAPTFRHQRFGLAGRPGDQKARTILHPKMSLFQNECKSYLCNASWVPSKGFSLSEEALHTGNEFQNNLCNVANTCLVARAIRQRDSPARINSRESFAIETPIFIARQADSHESLEFPIRANHPIKYVSNT